jgi:hypothetical protein
VLVVLVLLKEDDALVFNGREHPAEQLDSRALGRDAGDAGLWEGVETQERFVRAHLEVLPLPVAGVDDLLGLGP